MKAIKKTWKVSLLLAMMLVWSLCMPVMAASDDNSLSALNIHNGTLSRDFSYDVWEYDVTVEPGTTELLLEPTTSDPNASVTSITGTVLQDGKATVMVNTVSESGVPMTYTLYVKEEESVIETEAETEPETETQKQTEMETEPETIVQTEAQVEAENALQAQVSKLKSDSDLMMKILYGLVALTVILLFFIIHLILKNRDLKDDLKDVENQLAHQNNEFVRKERMMIPPVAEQPPVNTSVSGGYQGMQPQDVPPNLPITAEPAPQPVQEVVSPAEPVQLEASKMEAVQATEEEKKDVDVTMIQL